MIPFNLSRPLRIVLVGRVAIDFNPTDYNRPLNESSNFNKYLGGSPANIAVGMARLGDKVGFLGRVSDDQFGTYVTDYFRNEGIDVSHIRRCEHGEKLGLTFTEMLSPTESSILMYRDGVADLQLAPEDVDEAYIASASCLGILRMRVGARHRLSITSISEKRWNFWNTMPILRRISSTWPPLAAVISCPSMKTCPASGFSSRHSERRKTLLPQPEPPMMAMRWPCSTLRSTPFKTSRAPNDFFNPFTSIRLMPPSLLPLAECHASSLTAWRTD